MPSALAAADEPKSWCDVLHVGQTKYDWLRTRPIIFQEKFHFFVRNVKGVEDIRG